jgi:hypothetical protein
MGRAAKLKEARRMAERAAKSVPRAVAGTYAGAGFWRIIASIFWPGVLKKTRAKVQARMDALHEKALRTATKKTAHEVAKGLGGPRNNV